VTGALLMAGRAGSDVFEQRRQEITKWFPETDWVVKRVTGTR
jgi:hypothetical protein